MPMASGRGIPQLTPDILSPDVTSPRDWGTKDPEPHALGLVHHSSPSRAGEMLLFRCRCSECKARAGK